MNLQTVTKMLFVVVTSSYYPYLINANVGARKAIEVANRAENRAAQGQAKQDVKSGVGSTHNGKIIFQEDYNEPLLPFPTFPPRAHSERSPPTKGTIRIPTSQKTFHSGKTFTTPSSLEHNEKKTKRFMETFTTPIPIQSRPKEAASSPMAEDPDPSIHGSFYVPFRRIDGTKQNNGKNKTSYS